MKKITSSIAAGLAGVALSFGGLGAAMAQGEDPGWFEDPAEMPDDSLLEGVEQQELSGSFDQDTSDDWFYDTYEIEGEQQQELFDEADVLEPIFEDEQEYEEVEGLFNL